MSKGLDLIKRQQPEIIDGFPTGNIYIGVTKEELTELEKELKQAQEDKEVLNIFKNALTIKRTYVLPKEQESSDDTFSYACMYLFEIIQNDIDEKLRKSLREWVLKNAFPKETKALEVVKVFLKGRFSLHERKYVKDEQGNYGYVHFISFDDKNVHIKYPITQEEHDSLKEVLDYGK